MIFWEPRTEAEKKLLELYVVEEEEIQDQNHRPGERKRGRLGQEFHKAGRARQEKV